MKESKAASSVRGQLQAKQKAFQGELDAKEKALQAEDQALVKEKNTADKAAFEKKVKDFREKASNEQRAIQSKKAGLDKAFSGALEEILSRRFRHMEWGIPDLIVVDGSVAQENIAKQVLDRYQISIPVVAVVKDERHKAREIRGDKTIVSKYKDAILLVNSEAHRFAITFHKLKRSKNFLGKK